MSEPAAIEAPAPATGVSAPAAAPAAPSAAAAPAAPESLIHGDPAATNAAPSTVDPNAPTTDPFSELLGKVPAKFRVNGEGDKLDAAATLAKALEHRDHLEKRLGAGDLPPKSAAEYAFEMPEDLKDFALKQDRVEAFKAEALEHGITGEQFKWMMSSYLKAAPDLMEGAAAMTAAQARAELQKVWTTQADMDANIGNATRALRVLPAPLGEATRELGTNPAFLQVLAHFGAQMREDRPPAEGGGGGQVRTVEQLMRSEAYTNPKHADHARVSEQVRQHYARTVGNAPV